MYESTTSVVTDALTSSSPTIFNESTIARILALTTSETTGNVAVEQVVVTGGEVTVAAGTGIAHINSSATEQTTVNAPQNVPVVIFEGLGGVNATFNDGETTVVGGFGNVERVVIHSAGADNFIIADGKNTQITIGANDTVIAGAGNDTVVAGLGNSTIVGGTGHTIVQLGGNDSDYTVTVDNGRAVVTHSGNNIVTDISKVQFVQLDDGDALVFAKDSLEAAVASLYETTFGRAADASGLQFWFDRANEGITLEQIADAFTQVAEFEDIAQVSDEAFIESVYQQTFGRAADETGLDFWLTQLDNGIDRGDVLEAFANLSASNLVDNGDGETTIIGSVYFVPGVI